MCLGSKSSRNDDRESGNISECLAVSESSQSDDSECDESDSDGNTDDESRGDESGADMQKSPTAFDF